MTDEHFDADATDLIDAADDTAAPGEPDRVGPLRAIRRHCLDCSGTSNEVALCISTRCPLWLLRSGRKPRAEEVASVADVLTHPAEVPMTQAEVAGGSRLKAIRRRCLDCSGYSVTEVRGCTDTSCDLHQYRLGKNPNRVGRSLTDEQKAAAAARLASHRADTRLPPSDQATRAPLAKRAVGGCNHYPRPPPAAEALPKREKRQGGL